MWICVKAVERDLELVGVADTPTEIADVMYEDMKNDCEGETNLNALLNDNEADFNDSDLFGWCNYKNVNRDWKCFWI